MSRPEPRGVEWAVQDARRASEEIPVDLGIERPDSSTWSASGSLRLAGTHLTIRVEVSIRRTSAPASDH